MVTRSQRHKQEIQGTAINTGPVIAAWFAGTDTKTPVAVAAGKARCERLGVSNPRISKKITNLVAGKIYRLDTTHTPGTAVGNAYYRVSDDPNIPSPAAYGEYVASTSEAVVISFTAPLGGQVYAGLVQIADTNGMFSETKDVFTLTRTN
jgi:hypothetical protein